MTRICGLALGALLLPACATPLAEVHTLEPFLPEIPPRMSPPPVPLALARTHPQCRIAHPQAKIAFASTQRGARIWTVTFARSTADEIESQSLAHDGTERITIVELDCLLDELLREQCPDWIHNDDVAVPFMDGRLQSQGFCDAQSAKQPAIKKN